MSQQVDTGRGSLVRKEGRGGCGGCGGRGCGGGGYRGQTPFILKAFKSPIVEITSATFNTSQSKFAAQFTHSRKNIASYIQSSVGKESFLVAQTIRTGVLQTIDLPSPFSANDPDADKLTIVRVVVVKAVAKRRITLNQDLKKGFATVYEQCSQEVRDKLKSSEGWETVQTDQYLHQIILQI